MNERPSLRDILPPRERILPPQSTQTSPVSRPPTQVPIQRVRTRKFPYSVLYACLVLVLVVVASLYVFGTTKVTITPTVSDAYIQSDFTATKGTGDLSYEVVYIEKKAAKSVPAEGVSQVETFAEGEITVTNTSKDSQPLVKGTRFQNKDGLIFKIADSVTIPSGTQDKPGTIRVKVYASVADSKYNIEPTTFTIPGLKGSDIEPYIRAVSNEAFKGGYVGERPTVSTTTRSKVEMEIHDALAKANEAELAKQVPEGYVYVPGAQTTEYQTLPNVPEGAGTARVEVVGKTKAVVFKSEDLARAIGAKSIGSYKGERAVVETPSTLAVVGGSFAADEASYTFTLTGNTTLRYIIDQKKIADLLLGKSITGAKVILNELSEVEKAEIVLRPFFRGDMPDSADELEIVEKAR